MTSVVSDTNNSNKNNKINSTKMNNENTKNFLKKGNDCDICCESFTGSIRQPIECKNCDFVCCKSCVKTYLLQINTPKCMKCNVEWTDEFCKDILGSFMTTTHRTYKKKLLFDMEKARFPETMPSVERKINIKKLEREETEINIKIYNIEREFNRLKNMKYNITRKKNDMKNKKSNDVEKKFIRACPKNDCEGFLSTGWKCGVCDTKVCSKCFEIKETDEHVCNEDTLKSAQMIKKETKPCPACSSAIYKISGCDQMWCTQCQIAFSWKTGLKVNGTIHNPHYYQWMKENGGNIRQPGAAVCGGIPHLVRWREILTNIKNRNDIIPYINDIASMYINRNTYFRYLCLNRHNPAEQIRLYKSKTDDNIYVRIKGKHIKLKKKYYTMVNNAPKLKCPNAIINTFYIIYNIYKLHNKAQHFDNVILYEYRQKCQRNEDNQDLRIKYIMKEIDEKNMKTQLVKRSNKKKKENRILQIYEVYSQVVSDVLRDIVENNSIENIIEKWDKIEKIRKYCNYELLKISKLYKQMVPLIKFSGYKVSNKYCYLNRNSKEKKIEYTEYVDDYLNHNTPITTKQLDGMEDFKQDDNNNNNNNNITEDDMEFLNLYIEGCIDKRRNRF